MKLVKHEVGAEKPALNILVYGKPGAGKTLFASTAMDHKDLGDVLFLSCEGGLLTIADRQYTAIDLGRDELGRPNGQTLKDLEEAVWSVVTKAKGYENFKTIVLDSVTELQVRDLEDIIAEARAKKPDKPIDELGIADYGKSTSRMRRVLRMLRDANVNVIITALDKTLYEKVGQGPTAVDVAKEIVPSLTKSLADSVQGYFDFIWALVDKDGKRHLLTQPTGKFRAKTRFDTFAQKLGAVVVDPKLPAIYDCLCQSLKESTK